MKTSNDSPRPVSELIKEEFGFNVGRESQGREDVDNEKDKSSEKRNVSDKIVDLAFELGIELYLDQTGEPHVTFLEKPIVGFPVKSSVFRRWISGKYWEKYNKGFSGQCLLQVVNTIEGRAFHEGKTRSLFNRVARVGDTIFYDLGDDQKVVKVTTSGWEVITGCLERFRRFNHQLPQVEPKRGGDLLAVLNYLNLKTDTDKLLLLTYIPTIFIPDIPRVVLVYIGDQGAAKSTALRVTRSLIDPSIAELLSPPTNINELAQAANHHYCLYLDNLSFLRDELSDALCRLATGIGFTKRKLFTNDEDILFSPKVAVGITGINLPAQRADLLDRCLILSFERIPDEKLIDEEDFWKDFNQQKPYILGSIFDKLSIILNKYLSFKLPRKPRMADYAKYAAIAATTLGKSPEEFLSAFSENVERQNQEAIESSPTAQTILKFISDKEKWGGPSTELHGILKVIAEKNNLQIGGSDGFPKSSNWLWKRIERIRPNLLSLGVSVLKSEVTNSSVITIKKVLQKAENTAISASVAKDMAAMAVSTASSESCPVCDGKDFWKRPDGDLICSMCHPLSNKKS